MQAYQVTRAFGGYAPGAVLKDSDFNSPHRAAQLMSQRYLTPLASRDSQPTLAALRSATIRQLDGLVALVQDACVLEAAMQTEEREAARKAYAKRLGELSND